MSDLKTQPNDASVDKFIQALENEQRRNDCLTLLPIMQRVTQREPTMWGDSMIGFGRYHYRYKSGREGDWFITGFSPRKRELTVYIMPGFENYSALLEQLGKHRLGKSCLYIKKLSDVDITLLETLITQSITEMEARYDCS
ncbi:DUF1801 domain-containing protein [Leptolyngbya cf. ectocarpi LEGE 11479]|uniref:DUF1801 domain-containing protein n=1 Tax=Leptolyngbya cf. ectocarpi LEGE 11479 TaxID=1828722 RepID=A0A928ZWK5_LEPEC|nr:DUF1801 domain-containing protein [Leptolyngbya ectocarpi]MBE9068788.1 DUF1801 domain-containing protein [Leptolyngbya cf. ectocarpi LEGE 11479]